MPDQTTTIEINHSPTVTTADPSNRRVDVSLQAGPETAPAVDAPLEAEPEAPAAPEQPPRPNMLRRQSYIRRVSHSNVLRTRTPCCGDSCRFATVFISGVVVNSAIAAGLSAGLGALGQSIFNDHYDWVPTMDEILGTSAVGGAILGVAVIVAAMKNARSDFDAGAFLFALLFHLIIPLVSGSLGYTIMHQDLKRSRYDQDVVPPKGIFFCNALGTGIFATGLAAAAGIGAAVHYAKR